MNGAESVIRTAADAGIDVCFANPGTTELPFVAALDDVPEIRAVLGLFEGVCTGAADGYARMAGKPALTLLHLGPGFANGIANLHNARRARTPVVNLIGNQASWHMSADAPLTSDIESLARPVSAWVHSSTSAAALAGDAAAAIAEARRAPGRVSTLIMANDYLWAEAAGPAAVAAPVPLAAVTDDAVLSAAEALRTGRPGAIYLGGSGLSERGLRAAASIAATTESRLISETWPTRWERGQGLPVVEPLPYFPDAALGALDGVRTLVLAGADAPVSFFGYEEYPSILIPEGCSAVSLAGPEADASEALERLADALDAAPSGNAAAREKPSLPADGPLNPVSMGQTLAAVQPEGVVVMNEGATSGFPYIAAAASAPRHTYLTLSGGAIGQGMPTATGAAVACPDRPVLNIQADGSGMYTLQSLWTQAREHLDVTTVLCANNAYRILEIEIARAGIAEPGPQARSMTDLSGPALDWVQLAQGMGVPAVRVETVGALAEAVQRALAEPGPHLIEAPL